VVVCLDLLANRARFDELSSLLVEAVEAAKPTPQVLWRWAAEYVEFLNAQASKSLVDAQLHNLCPRQSPDFAESAAKSGEYLLALLACAVEAMAGDDLPAWHALAQPVVTAALRHQRRGFHYDAFALDVLSALGALVDPRAPPPWLAALAACAAKATDARDFMRALFNL
jgi:hypothetical protein